MIIGTAVVELYIPGAQSLKDKRRVLRGALERARARFNVSLAELDQQDRWQFATLGLACVSTSTGHAHQSLQTVIKYLETVPGAEVIDYRLEVY